MGNSYLWSTLLNEKCCGSVIRWIRSERAQQDNCIFDHDKLTISVPAFSVTHAASIYLSFVASSTTPTKWHQIRLARHTYVASIYDSRKPCMCWASHRKIAGCGRLHRRTLVDRERTGHFGKTSPLRVACTKQLSHQSNDNLSSCDLICVMDPATLRLRTCIHKQDHHA